MAPEPGYGSGVFLCSDAKRGTEWCGCMFPGLTLARHAIAGIFRHDTGPRSAPATRQRHGFTLRASR